MHISPNGVEIAVGSGTYFGYNVVNISSPGVASSCITTSTGFIYEIGLQCVNAGNTGSVSIQVTGAGYAYASGSQLGGGATGKAISCAATSTCETGPGNTYNANPIGNIGCAVSSASPAACAKNRIGIVAVPTAAATYTVNTTAITPNSVIVLSQDTSTQAGTALGVTCNTTVSTALPLVTAKVIGTSFTFSLTGSAVNPICIGYTMLN